MTEKKAHWFYFALIIVLYIASSAFTFFAARSPIVVNLSGIKLPMSAFAGVCSSLSNILLIMLVVLYHKIGLIVSLAFIVTQLPMLFQGIIKHQNLTNIPGLFGFLFTIIAICMIYQSNSKIERLQMDEIRHLKKEKLLSQRLFEQTAISLVNAIDAKDTYSCGHSVRVAEYSEKIARAMGKDDDECYKIYYSALLHDVGKIGISDAIINKKGKLTEEEYEAIKQHPVLGNQILASIGEYPYISIGAHFHHERYDGKGYPDKMKGEDIPEIARIIAVADAYDAMTSTRSYRDPIPQAKVREEFVKNSGTQFDPNIAKVMIGLIDQDKDYQLKERSTVQELAGKSSLYCDYFGSEISEGIIVMPYLTKVELDFLSNGKTSGKVNVPAIILFDSEDGRVHRYDGAAKDLNYYEFGLIHFDGRTECEGARKMQTNIIKKSGEKTKSPKSNMKKYVLEATRFGDHALIRIDDGEKILEITVALPDSSRYTYMSLTGEKCEITDVSITKSKERITEDFIPRIAEKVSFIDAPDGDIPNVQIDGFRRASSQGIPIEDGLKVRFHTKSLPTARLIWHCPYIIVFHSMDGVVFGCDYREYALIRLDGENWHNEENGSNQLIVEKTDAFSDWDEWKKSNKEGFDCELSFEKKDNTITITTENLGVKVKNITTVNDGNDEFYVALIGDQCALTDIRIIK